jgi:RNA polymerase sigma factor (sigma-70 family)
MHNLVTPVVAREHALQLARDASRDARERAWQDVVREFTPTLRGIVRGYGFQPADVDDVVQLTWLQAHARIVSLRDPSAFPGWLAQIARRCAIRERRRPSRREHLIDAIPEEAERVGDTVEDAVAATERRDAVRAAVERLPARQRAVIEALLASDWAGYDEVADRLGMPIGSIGPTRARSLARLRGDAHLTTVIAQ